MYTYTVRKEASCTDVSVSPSIITSRRSAWFEFGNYIMWACIYCTFTGGGVGQLAVNHLRNNESTMSIIGV